MTELEHQPFRITKEGPTVHNQNWPEQHRFTTTTYKLESPDGKPAVVVRFTHEAGHYAVTWEDLSLSPNTFFVEAQALVNTIKEAGKAQPLDKKAFHGLDYALKGGQRVELDMDDFLPLDDLDRDELVFARFNTPYGDFVCESPTEDKETSFQAGFVTHINFPNELSQFVLRNSSKDIPSEMLTEILTTVGNQAEQR